MPVDSIIVVKFSFLRSVLETKRCKALDLPDMQSILSVWYSASFRIAEKVI